MTAWRAAGITYIQYSNIAARVLREALRTELRVDAAKRDASHVKFTPWANGRPAQRQTTQSES
ncbi:protein stunted isoform X1 [Drosophila gunungcola]|uniref:protein stunted isoform X1 n=1 Tax=Drosophila elegans TaxID=30023 RepID=UPI0007E8627C|nr:protein stunted isoform X1 [Drosophila elegans]XP_052849514.1 protein stunted isoform X1 [Drosophila gunungcola]